MPQTLKRTNIITFVFWGWDLSSTRAAVSHERLPCWTDSQVFNSGLNCYLPDISALSCASYSASCGLRSLFRVNNIVKKYRFILFKKNEEWSLLWLTTSFVCSVPGPKFNVDFIWTHVWPESGHLSVKTVVVTCNKE